MIGIIFAVLLFCPEGFNKPQEALPTITVEQAEGTEEGEFPISIGVKVPIEGKEQDFSYVLVSQESNQAFYIVHNSVFRMILTRKEEGSEFIYDGSFLLKGFYYLFYPTSSRVPPADTEVILYMIEDEHYTVVKQAFPAMSGESYGADVIPNDDHQALTIELFVHIDYSLYFKWLEFKEGDVDKAMRGIMIYYSNVLHGVNDLYERINRADFSISTHVKRLYVETTRTLYGDDNYNVTLEPIGMGPYEAIEAATESFRSLSDTDDYDAAVYIANLDMRGALGAAFGRSVCSAIGVVILTNLNQRDLTHSMTHELAHVLGAAHDQRYVNSCEPGDQNIMAPSFLPLRENNLVNFFKFSPCTITYFKLNLEKLESLDNNCMLNGESAAQAIDDDVEWVGHRYSPDQQCKLLIGPESYYCGDKPHTAEICQRLQCYSASYNSCSTSERRTAADGTQCGSQKWCHDGFCVEATID